MPKPYRTTVTGSSGVSTPWMPDYGQDPFAIGIGCVPTTSNVVYSIQHTFDPLFSNSQIPGTSVVLASLATWYEHATITGVSCNIDGNYAFGVLGLRARISSASSATGSVTVTFVQAGP
jgi:hypothetical protein